MSDDLVVTDTRVDLGALLQAQKTELVSRLAGAMANQFNNVMMAITGYAELELKNATPAQKRSLEKILSHTAQATTLIQKFLDFTRKRPPAPRKLELNPVVEQISQLLQPLVGEEIEVAISLDSSAGIIVADQAEIEQQVLSLGLNARDVMSRGGKLTISTQAVNLDAKDFSPEEMTNSSSYVLLCVQYTPVPGSDFAGDGRHPVANQEVRITQVIAAMRGLVKERRGILRVSSRSGQGTTFRVYFPAQGTGTAKQETEPIIANITPSTKTILIVEDDEAVRNPAAEFLKMEGFKVLQAGNGSEALRIVQESRSRLDLLVTDIVMAGMNGNELADTLLRAHPGLRVLYMSGDSDKAKKVAAGASAGKGVVMQKPFRLNKLNDKIHELLDQ